VEQARVVLVTNVGQGFGRAVALSYGQAGYDVVCADADVDMASKTAAEVEELGAQAIPVQADVSSQLDVRSVFGKVHEIFGDLSGVVHVATHHSHTPFSRLTESEFAELMREDVTSTYLVLREALRALAPTWVVIVTPPRSADHPQMAAVHGAISNMASTFAGDGPAMPRDVLDFADIGAPEPAVTGRPRVNVVVPSRAPSDPRHDARLANTVRYLGSAASTGVSGITVSIDLPPPPRVTESLLPEVRAALDDTMRQDDRERPRDEGDFDEVEVYGRDVRGTGGEDELEDEQVGRRRPGIGALFDDDEHAGEGDDGVGVDPEDESADAPDDEPTDAPEDEYAERYRDDDAASLETEGLDEDGIGASVRALSKLERREGYGHDLTPAEPARRGRGGR
jgi:NAD(P)-dependent dehydrogenase (short-subunit alcohol dehydrogenase family)